MNGRAIALLACSGALLGQAPPRERFVHNFGYVPMRDGAQIAYTLWRPAVPARRPTLMIYNMYDASSITPEFNQTVTPEIGDYLERGYAVLGANARGTGCSSGEADVLHAEQVGRDGAEVVEWIARQPWSDGGVGMFGHSGSGVTQFYVAAQNPPHLKAIIPGAAPADIYKEVAYPGWLFNYAFMYHWAEDAQPASSARAAKAHIDAGDTACAERVKKRPPSDFFWELKRRPAPDDWWAVRSVNPVAGRIRVPAFIIFGWQDQNVGASAVSVFDRLAGPKRMLLAEQGHSFYIRSMEARREKLRFFDHWLKGAANGAMDGNPIQVWFTMKGSIEAIPERVGRYERLPPPQTKWTKWHLAPGSRLAAAPPETPASAKYLYPMGTAFVYGGAGYPHTPFGLGSLTFLSEPLLKEMTILGPMTTRLFVSSTQTDTSFLVVLSEITAAAERKYLQRGYLLASMRTGRLKPLEPNQVTEFEIDLGATGSVIRSGSKLELLVMAPKTEPEPLGQWGFLPLPMGINTIYMSRDRPSHILLPVAP